MRLLIAVVTHNRLEYTKKCLRSLDESLSNDDCIDEEDDYYVTVIDNASTDGTQEWLRSDELGGGFYLHDNLILNKANRFPGAACNQAWMVGLQKFDATHLCRIDNDCLMHDGWFTEAKDCFNSFPDLGQFGLIEMSDAKEFEYIKRTNDETNMSINTGPTNIGGPCIVDRKLWDDGLRYSEMPWQHFGGPTPQEDVKLSLDIKAMGMFFGNTVDRIVTEMSFGNTDDFYSYYERTFAQRGHAAPDRTKDGSTVEHISGSDHI